MGAPDAVLRRFYRPSTANPALDVLVAARAARLLPPITSGSLTFGNDGAPAPGGVHDPEIFGASGKGHARIDLCGPVIHRALGATIASCLGVTEAELWRIVYEEVALRRGRIEAVPVDEDPSPFLSRTGPSGLRALLARAPADRLPPQLTAAGFRPVDLLLKTILVVPPSQRPLERAEGGALMPGAASVRYQALMVADYRLAQAFTKARYYRWPINTAHESHVDLQTAFEALCVQFGPERPGPDELIAARRPGFGFRRRDRLVVPPAPPAPRFPVIDSEWGPRIPPGQSAWLGGCAFAGTDRILVGFGYALAEVSIPGGSLFLHPVVGTHLVWASPDGRQAAAFGWALRVLDLTSRQWVTEPPTDPFLLALGAEDSVTDWEPIEAIGERMRTAFSPDGRYVWAEEENGGGGIYARATGLRRFNVAWAANWQWGWDVRNDYRPDHDGGSAFVLDRDDQWRFFFSDELVIGGQTRWRAPSPVHAAGFSRDGERLVVASRESITVLSLAEATPRVECELSLLPLTAAAAARVRIPPEVRHKVLCRYGTLAAAAAAGRDELLAIPGVGPSRVKTILAAARRQRVPARLPIVKR